MLPGEQSPQNPTAKLGQSADPLEPLLAGAQPVTALPKSISEL